MSVFILYIDKKNPPVQDAIDEIIERHRTPQDAVAIKRTSENLTGGFQIFKEDDTLENVLRRDSKLTPTNTTDRVRQASVEKDGAKYSGDQTFKGAKPYRNY